jgi:hypothetical protein
MKDSQYLGMTKWAKTVVSVIELAGACKFLFSILRVDDKMDLCSERKNEMLTAGGLLSIVDCRLHLFFHIP